MSKVSIDIEYIKSKLNDIGYEISDCVERENNGVNWQLKFSNSGELLPYMILTEQKTLLLMVKLKKMKKIL